MSDQSNEGAQAPFGIPAEQTAAGVEAQADASQMPEPGAPSGPTPNEAWADVVTQLGELGDALSAWAKAASDTPENRQHIDEVRSGVNDMARQASEAFSAVAGSDFGRQFSEGATQVGQAIGGTAQEFSQAAAPHVASAFAGLADVFGRAAQKVSEATSQHAAEPPSRPAPEPPSAEQPVAPAWPETIAPAEPAAPAAPTAPQAASEAAASPEAPSDEEMREDLRQ
jgi:hypothetical protein